MENEQALVQEAKEDFSKFGQLYEHYFQKIYNYVYSMLRSHAATEDVVSETFEKALINLSSYEYRGYSFGAWLYRIARNAALDYIKSNKKVTPFDQESVLSVGAVIDKKSTETKAEDQILQENLWQAIMQLKESYREVIVLRHIEGYSVKETAEIVKRSEDSVKSTTKRALKKLRKLMQNSS